MQILDPRMKIHAVGPSTSDFQPYNTDLPANGLGPNYYQTISSDAYFLIMKETITVDVTNTLFYVNKDISEVDTDWTGRAALTYVRIDELIGE